MAATRRGAALTGPGIPAGPRRGRRRARRAALRAGLGALGLYLLAAYLVLPWAWWVAERRHPALDGLPKATRNADGIPGDPLNVALVGSRAALAAAMLATGWQPADPVTLASSLGIAASVLFHRPDPDAPVSALFVFGRAQDLAFEQEVGGSADRRHHVRWWQAPGRDAAGRPLWIGAVTFDTGAGFSRLTGQITHRIGPDVDAERDRLMAGLAAAGLLAGRYRWPGVGPTEDGRNAGGDRYRTDGMVEVGVLAAAGDPPP